MRTRSVFRYMTGAAAVGLCLAMVSPMAVAAPGGAGGPDSSQSHAAAAARPRPDAAWQRALTGLTDAKAVSAIAEVRDRDGTWRGSSGTADRATGAPVRQDGRFRIGSVTKTFVATALLQLVGDGKIGLDDLVARHLPGVLPQVGGKESQITVRQVLNQTTGLYDATNEIGPIFPDLGDPAVFRTWVSQGGLTRTYTARQLVAASVGDPKVPGSGHPPYFAPGTAWGYSNTNYVLAGMLIEQVTGHSYAQQIEQRILRPLGMTRTTFPGTSTRIPGPHVQAYWPVGPDAVDVTAINPSWAGAAGEMISTSDDLLRFNRALMSGRLLRPAQQREMTTTLPTDATSNQLRYGMGLARVELSCTAIWGHNGGIFGFSTQLWSAGDRQLVMSYTPLGNDTELEAQNQAVMDMLEAVFCGGHQPKQAITSPASTGGGALIH